MIKFHEFYIQQLTNPNHSKTAQIIPKSVSCIKIAGMQARITSNFIK